MCDMQWESVIRCDEKIGAWESIQKLPTSNGFVSNLGDKVW